MTPYEFLVSLCGGNRTLILLHALSNTIIGAAYISIPIAIVAYLRRRPDIENRWLFWAFTAFILGCGATHFMHVLSLWDARFYVGALWVDGFTALVSAVTAIALWPMLPLLASIPTPKEFLAMLTERDDAVAELGGHKEVLVKELNHRVRNNLQILQSVVAMMMTSPETKAMSQEEILSTVLNRIKAVSRVHDRIYQSGVEPGQIDTKEFVETICQDLSTQFGVESRTDVDSRYLSADESTPIAMIVNEMVTNAIKHGRRAEAPAEIDVSLKHIADGGWRLAVQDRGPGLPESASRSTSLGMRLIRSLARQLGGELSVESSPNGSRFSVTQQA